MTDAWCGVDLGTQSARALVLDDRGQRLALEAAPLTSTRDGDRHEQDPAEWLQVVETLLRRATAALPAGVSIRAVAVSGTSGTIVPLDARGRIAGMAAMYDDRRGAPWLLEVQEAGTALWQRLGVRMQASWGLPKLLAMRASMPNGTRFAHQPDVVTGALLGGRAPSDLSSALKTGADLDQVAWPTDVLETLELPRSVLPDLAETGAILGGVARDAAERTGLPEGCVVIAGCTDGCAAQFAAGALEPGTWNSVLGTTLVIKGIAPTRRPDPSGAVYAHRAPFDAGWLPGGASNTGARAITALLPGRDLAAVTSAAAALPGIPIAYPLLGRGERFPIVDDDAQAFWPHADPPTSDAELMRAIAFGTAFVERLAFETLDTIGYPTGGPILFTGGGARNGWWNAVRAAVLQRAVAVPTETEGAAGMAVLAAAALEDRSHPTPMRHAAERLLGPAVDVEPLKLDRGAIDHAYDEFRRRLDRTPG